MANKRTTRKPAATPHGPGKNRVEKKPAKRRAPAIDQSTRAQGGARDENRGFAVVGIGASAGGLKALISFFEAMPADSGLAFVLVQHLDPTHQSLSAELIGRRTQMSVVEVRDAMRVEPNGVYVIPPNRYLTIGERTLHLTEPLERRGLRAPIDFFFRSLAQDQQERGIGIILSGSGSDGTLGLREIKAEGGIVLVQSPETCQFDGMPRSAIATGIVDSVLPVEKMPEVLTRYARHSYLKGDGAPATVPEKSPDHLSMIVGLLQARVKYDFSCYKRGTVIRRVQRRMSLLHIDDMPGYIEYLRQNQDEATALFKDMLIGVTNFFRDTEVWESLTKLVIAPLVQDCDPHAPLRVWVPGCATGEEAYSIAMLLAEQIELAGKSCEIHIFASDIDHEALQTARAGIYPENIAADVSPERLKKFFVKGERACRINKEIREELVFAEQNVISDPPFSKLDLISCRNLLIYLDAAIQKKILSLFHFALRPGGYLLLGGSETISTQHDLFMPVSRKCRIFRRVGLARHEKLDLPALATDKRPSAEAPAKVPEPPNRRLVLIAQQLLLQRFAPACLLINQKAEVLYLHGPVDRYLQLPSGELAPDLLGMARESLRTKLRSAVHLASHENRRAQVTANRVEIQGKFHSVRINVEPFKQPHEAEGLFLVTFEEHEPPQAGPPPLLSEAQARSRVSAEADYEAIIASLEDRLRTTREDLQSTVEELETSNEEFKAANEEVTSVNEELQSANEELETSKEELQSLNEELQTVNSQLEQKVNELETTNDDLANLLACTDIPTIFLDQHFCIKRFTPATTRLFRLIETDVGRPISDIAQSFTDAQLRRDSEIVLQKLTTIEKEIEDREGRWYLRRIAPYRTDDSRIAGVVITFTDVTATKEHARAVRTLNTQLEERVAERTAKAEQQARQLIDKQVVIDAMLDSTSEAVVVIDDHRNYLLYNRAAQKLFDFDPRAPKDARWPQHYGVVETGEHTPVPEDSLPTTRALRGEEVHNVELFIRSPNRPEGRWIEINSSPLRNDKGAIVGAVSIGHDMTEHRRLAEDRARLAAIMQDASASIWIIAPEGTILDWNRGAERLLGYRPPEIVGRNVSLIIPPERADEFERFFQQLQQSRSSEIFETVVLRQDGSRVDLAMTASHIVGSAGSAEVCVVALDIRERKRIEHQIAELAEGERQRIGHELHDTLGQQITAAGLILKAVKEQLGEDSSQATSLKKLESLIDQSKTQLRSIAKGLFPVDLDASGLRVALAELAAEVRQVQKIDCRVECPEAIQLTDSYVATQLFLIAREAVHNALKHSQARNIAIRLDDGTGLRLSVFDDGIGIDQSTKSTDGMGVDIMRYRSGLIGGSLRIESPDSGGTQVTCLLAPKT